MVFPHAGNDLKTQWFTIPASNISIASGSSRDSMV
jgi:hypothetical protein